MHGCHKDNKDRVYSNTALPPLLTQQHSETGQSEPVCCCLSDQDEQDLSFEIQAENHLCDCLCKGMKKVLKLTIREAAISSSFKAALWFEGFTSRHQRYACVLLATTNRVRAMKNAFMSRGYQSLVVTFSGVLQISRGAIF